ncbi:MAG TPA: 5-formyltetrahydrofolate cyclo-ligase [Gammaproteobacteria bacterium]
MPAAQINQTSDWRTVQAWRKAERTRLLAARLALPRTERRRLASLVAEHLTHAMPSLRGRRLGFYWPIQGELDLVRVVRAALNELEAAALPVVVERNRPLEFWRWTARTELCSRGLWNIPSPAERIPIVPDVLLVPLLGFDGEGYRLGYGGGYYDRTLAAMEVKPFTIGVGLELGRLDTIYPQPHDIPMDAIVTESTQVVLRPA